MERIFLTSVKVKDPFNLVLTLEGELLINSKEGITVKTFELGEILSFYDGVFNSEWGQISYHQIKKYGIPISLSDELAEQLITLEEKEW